MLKLYQSNRVEYLRDLLAGVVAQPLQEPFASETIVVQHAGIGRWLSLQLADRLGICANIQFPLPAAFLWSMLRLILNDIPGENRYTPEVMRWESEDVALLGEQMARLSRLAHRIVWVNPRKQSDRYQPLVGGMAAALPHVDVFTSGHSLDALDDVLTAIADE